MTGKQRLMTALELKQPDMVPIWEMAFNEPSIIGIARNFVEDEKLPEPKLAMDMSDTERIQLLGGLIAFAREHIAHYKCPRTVDFETELPRLATGKLYKRLLRDRYWKGHQTQVV